MAGRWRVLDARVGAIKREKGGAGRKGEKEVIHSSIIRVILLGKQVFQPSPFDKGLLRKINLVMRSLLLLLSLILLDGCQLLEPKETAATIYRYRVTALCMCCSNLAVRIGSERYQTHNVPAAFFPDTLPANVDSLKAWIRYKQDDSECGRAVKNLIFITSMRERSQ